MNRRVVSPILVAAIASALSFSAQAQLQLNCPLDWSALSAIDAPDQQKVIFGLKASDWTKEHVDQMLAKDAECVQQSPDADSIKQAYEAALTHQLYPNAMASIARRDERLEQQRAAAVRDADQAQQAAMQAQAAVDVPPAPVAEVPAPAIVALPAPAAVVETAAQNPSPQAPSQSSNTSLYAGLAVLAAAAIWGWNRFVRNRCPSCKTTSVSCLDESEIDRWRGTKQVSEKNSRGTNTRHMQTTYVKTRFEYECNHCQEEWSKVRKEELGSHSSVDRFFSGY